MSKSQHVPSRCERLVAFLRQHAVEEGKSGFDELAADLNQLADVVALVEPCVTSAAGVPEWGNHTNEKGGGLDRLGTVMGTYASWIEEGEEPACEHDGACQLAEMSVGLSPLLNALDGLCYSRNGDLE